MMSHLLKVSGIDFRITDTGAARSAYYDGAACTVRVYQDMDYMTGKMEEPRISWGAPSGVRADIAANFAEAIRAAVILAQMWDKDTGKPRKADGR